VKQRVSATSLAALRDNVGTRGFTPQADRILDLIADLEDARRAVEVLDRRLAVCLRAGKVLAASLREVEQP
jgi:hypothetical protein